MTDLAEHGFLSTELAGVAAVIEHRYGPWLAMVRAINARAVKAQYEAQVHHRYLPELVAATAYMRTLTNVQAAVLMAGQGLDVPARILLRAGMESLFQVAAVERDRNVVNAIVAGDDVFRTKLFAKYQRIKDPNLAVALDGMAPPSSDTSERFKEWGVKPLTVEQLAARADLTNLYLSTYPVLSNTVHAGIRDLERHLETGTDGEVVALKNEPNVDGLEVLFLMAGEFLLAALEAFGSVVKMDLGDFCEASRARIKALADSHRRA